MFKNRLMRLSLATLPNDLSLAFGMFTRSMRRAKHKVRALEIELGGDTQLGRKGDRLSLPLDAMITPAVIRDGAWDPQLSDVFLAYFARAGEHDLIDLGANCGLFTRQVLTGGAPVKNVHCIEADPDNFAHLSRNLAPFPSAACHNIGVGDETKATTFYRDALNHGNNSFLQSSVVAEQAMATTINMIQAADFFAKIEDRLGPRIAIKCDIQGLDEMVLSLIPNTVWARVEFVAVEISRIDKPAIDLPAFAARLAPFEIRRLQDGASVTIDEFIIFANGRDGTHADYLLTRQLR